MPAFAKIIIGVALVAATILTGGALAPVLVEFLISAGASLVLTGIGTLLTKHPSAPNGAQRNPIAPWNVIYGRAKVGGTVVYIEENGDSNKYLHQVIVLACHPCQSVDALYFDNKRVVLDRNGNSISFGDSTAIIGSQRTSNIQSISRANDVVTVVLQNPIAPPDPASQYPYVALMDGDMLIVQNVGADRTLNGTWAVSVLSATSFSYICGGNPISITGQGSVKTTYPDYGDTVHMEVLLGNHTSTFPGLLAGSNGLWTSQHLLLGHTAVYLRLKYGGQTYGNGLPTISFLVRGKSDIYDPRSDSHRYTENAALCIADLLAHPTWGFKALYGTEIPNDPLTAAANVCDEAVPLAARSTEPRYTCNGAFALSTKRGEVLQNLLTSCGGRLTYTGGQFRIVPAAWNGASLQLGANPGAPGAPIIVPSTAAVYRVDWEDQYGGDDFAYGDGILEIAFDGQGGATLRFLGDTEEGTAVAYDDYGVGNLKLVGATAGIGPVPIPNLPAPGQELILTIFCPSGPFYSGPGSRNPDGVAHSVLLSSTADPNVPGILADASGPFHWRPKLALRDLYNGVKGTYVSPVSNWQTSDFPAYAQDQMHGYSNGPAQYLHDANLAADGGDRRWLDIQLPFTISTPTAQRLAKIELLRRRQQGTGTFAFNMALYRYTALDCVYFTLPALGWYGKLLEITAHRFTQTKQQAGNGQDVTLLGTEIDVQETHPSVYDWSPTEELSAAGFQQAALPTMQSPQPPTGLNTQSDATTSVVSASGIATSRILVSWYPPDDGYVTNGGHIEIRYAPAGQTTWIGLPQTDPSTTQAYITGVTEGASYTIQMRSVNAAGIASPWQTTAATASGAASQIPYASLDGSPTFTVNGG